MSIFGEINKKEIDWGAVEKEIRALGNKINEIDEIDDSFTVLSEIYLDYRGKGSVLARLTELFLKCGFDVQGNNGRNGAGCLHNLCRRINKEDILQISEILLDAGCDTKVRFDEGDDSDEGLLSTICFNLGDWASGDYDSANDFEAYYEQVSAYQDGQPYKGIRTFHDSVGLTVEKVEKLSFDKESIIYDFENRDSFKGALAIWAGGIPLIISNSIDFIVNPHTPNKAVNRLDISQDFKEIIGAQISGLKFISAESALLEFGNGYKLRLINSYVWGGQERHSAKYILEDSNETCPLHSGMIVDAIYLQRGGYWSPNVYKYTESTIILAIGNALYQIYAEEEEGENYSLKIETIPKSWIGPYNRRMETNRMLVGAVMLNDNNQAVLIQLTDGKENLYITVSEQVQKVFFARTFYNENGEEEYKHITFIDDTFTE